MSKSQINPVALLAAAVAAVLALMLARPFDYLSSIGGLVLLLVLLAYDGEGYRTMFQSLAFSSVCGLCTMAVVSLLFRLAPSRPEVATGWEFRPLSGNPAQWLPLIWVGATIIFWAIDRARMSNRQDIASEPARQAIPAHRSFIPDYPAPASSPLRTVTPPPAPPAPAREPVPAPVAVAAPMVAAATPPPPAPAPPERHGKETMIYVTLMDEGLNVLRSVKAEHLGHDYYRIVDSMPEGETWQYGPGQVVRCKKRNLSSGKALVAIEEAPRSA